MNGRDQSRPDPDRLLGGILAEEAKSGKGKLKVFFGMAAGVGKTYAMLEEARRMEAEGKEVVIGYVENHGRRETERLADGLEALPRKMIDCGAFSVPEFDLDAALERRPGFILVDELAHTNAEGSRHFKRYQDVFELLEHGISVLTTLNIQHLESQADIVEKITGVKIRETLPDLVLDRADEVELVDIPTEELLKRLEEGKIYLPEKTGIAAANFFRESNITALRELALHYVAQVVGSDLDDIVRRKEIRGAWKAGEKILVAVSASPYSEYLIRWTKRLALNIKANWIALYIESSRPLTGQSQQKLQNNLSLARELGAEVLYTADEDIVEGVLRAATENNVTQIIIGKPLRRYLSDFFRGGNLVERMLRRCGDIEIHVVTQPHAPSRRYFNMISAAGLTPLREYFIALLAVLSATLAGAAVHPVAGYWGIALLYLLSIVLVALRVGRGPVLLAAALCAVLWDYLFIPPKFNLRIERIEDVMMFGMFFTVATVLGALTSKLKLKERALRRREGRISALYELSKSLDAAHSPGEIASVSAEYVKRYLGMDSAIFLTAEDGTLEEQTHIAGRIELSGKDRGVVEWVWKNGIAAGIFTKTLPQSAAYFVPLRSAGGVSGVIGLRPETTAALDPELDSFILNMVSQITIHLEHEKLFSARRRALLAVESEHLYKVLLNSISHELRTPLTAITGASSGLLDPTISDDAQTRSGLIREIHRAGERLNRLVDNLLDMSRLESGMLKLKKQEYDLRDLVSAALRRLDDELASRPVTVSVPDDMPPAFIDFTLMEQVLVNLLHNAAMYTPAGCAVAVSLSADDASLVIEVSDNGPGIEPDDMPFLFDKFRRGAHVPAGGTGLGLSICRGIVEAHGGTIRAGNGRDGGAVFTVSIPREHHGEGEA